MKVSRRVLKGLGTGNGPRLPGDKPLIWNVILIKNNMVK